MNRHYLLLTSALVAGTCFAQSGRNKPYAMQHAETTMEQIAPPVGTQRDGGDVVFSEDFANGFAGNNGFGAWTTSGPNGNIWKRALTGPVGSYSVVSQRIASATVANGFAAFYSDSANCMCTSGTANWPASPTEWDGALESPLLDLSATPSVALRFSQRLRWCCQATSPHMLQVSTNGGVSWNDVLSTAVGIATNNDPGTETRQIMLTAAIAADPSNVKFRFQHNPTAAAYHWQIDDVQLVELYNDDLKMDDGIFSQDGEGEEYGRIPTDQLRPTMLQGGNVTNNGAVEQSNVTVTVDVTGPVPFNSAINGGIVSPGATLEVTEDYALPALTPGQYDGTFTVSADNPDQIPANNQYFRNFEVNDALYSLDGIGIHPAASQTTATLGTSSFTGAADGLILLNYYDVTNPLTVYGVELVLGSTTVAGGYVIVNLRDTTPVFADNMIPVLAESDPQDIEAIHVSQGFARVCFPDPVVLANNGYFASVSLFSNAEAAHIRIVDDLTVTQPNIASAIYIPNDQVYSNGNALGIRLITQQFGCTVGVQDNGTLQGVSLYPNPSNGLLSINVTEAGSYTIEVIDALGARVISKRSNGNTTLDLSGQAKGVYSVRIASENASVVKRVTLN